MDNEKYVKLSSVRHLLKLMYRRDCFYDWSENYEREDKKIKEFIQLIEANAETIDDIIKEN